MPRTLQTQIQIYKWRKKPEGTSLQLNILKHRTHHHRRQLWRWSIGWILPWNSKWQWHEMENKIRFENPPTLSRLCMLPWPENRLTSYYLIILKHGESLTILNVIFNLCSSEGLIDLSKSLLIPKIIIHPTKLCRNIPHCNKEQYSTIRWLIRSNTMFKACECSKNGILSNPDMDSSDEKRALDKDTPTSPIAYNIKRGNKMTRLSIS